MAWYGLRRSGERRMAARAVVVGLGLAMVGVLAIQTSSAVRGGIDISRRSMDGVAANLTKHAVFGPGFVVGTRHADIHTAVSDKAGLAGDCLGDVNQRAIIGAAHIGIGLMGATVA